MPNPRKINVLVIDAQPVSRAGLCALLHAHPELRLAGEAASVSGGRDLALRLKPQVIVIDPSVPGGAVAIVDLRRASPNSQFVILTSLVGALHVQRAFLAGACGYVTRFDPVESLIQAITGASQGMRHVGPQVERILLERLASGSFLVSEDDLAVLSPRETEVFRLIGEGRSTRAMAVELGLSTKTIETHRERMKAKLRLRDGAALHRRAVLAAA